MTNESALGLTLEERIEPYGRLRLALVDHATGFRVDVSTLTVDAISLSDGNGGTIRCGGVGNVETLPSYRRRGLAARLLTHAIERMSGDGLDASLLYGIDDYYDRLGWQDCGDERWVRMSLDPRVRLPLPPTDIAMRPMEPGDRAQLAQAHAQIAAAQRGAAMREPDGRAWSRLSLGEMRVAQRHGQVVGWAWRGLDGPPARGDVAGREPDAVVFAELQAVDADAMRAVIVDAHAWAREQREEPRRDQLLVGAPDAHPLRRLARSGELAATLEDEVRPTGGPMLLPFTDAARALRSDLYQHLPDRF